MSSFTSLLLLLALWVALTTSTSASTTALRRHFSAPIAATDAETLVTPHTYRPYHRSNSLNRRYQERLATGELELPVGAPAPAQFIAQRLDHFDPTSTETWNQLYYVNDTLFDRTLKQPVVMFIIGWEGAMNPSFVNGAWVTTTLAQEFSALQVVLEHRFYGQSVPNKNNDISRLRYLTSEQALADAAHFVTSINQQYNLSADTVKWVVVSGSYGGWLAAQMRSKYPHLIAASLAISAPLEAQVDYAGYNQMVNNALPDDCRAFIRAANDKVTQVLSSSDGFSQITKDFNLCSPGVHDNITAAMFVSEWSYSIGGTVQYNTISNSGSTIKTFCQKLMATDPDPYTAFQSYFYKRNNGTGCTQAPDYKQMIKELQQPSDDRSWTSQTCHAFGYFQAASGGDLQPFSPYLSVNLSIAMCADAFNISVGQLYANIAETNEYYGAKKLVTSHVYFSSGEFDPWRPASLSPPSTQPSVDNFASVIANGSHCLDFETPRASDSDSLKQTRMLQAQQLRTWFY